MLADAWTFQLLDHICDAQVTDTREQSEQAGVAHCHYLSHHLAVWRLQVNLCQGVFPPKKSVSADVVSGAVTQHARLFVAFVGQCAGIL